MSVLLAEKDLVTPTHSVHYNYLFKSPAPGKPTLLFLHGFPESRFCWRNQLPFVAQLGYGVIAPDLLGYGKTAKPGDAAEFKYKRQIESILDILDHEGVKKFVVLGHDWGVLPTSRIINYAQSRILCAVFIAGPYYPPKEPVDLDAANAWSKKTVGYERRGYFHFMNQSDSGEIIKKHVDAFISLWWNEDPSIWATHFCPPGAMQKWLEADTISPTAKWFTKDDYAFYRKSLLDGIEFQTNWYRVAVNNLSYDEEIKAMPEGAEFIKVPVLIMPCTQDRASIPHLAREISAKFCEDLEIRELDSSHWAPAEVPDLVNKNIKEFLEARLPKDL